MNFFPPRDEISAVDFGINVGQLMKLKPSFVSVTYGAGGSNQDRTFALVDYLQNKIGMVVMAHYTCVNSSEEKVKSDFHFLNNIGIENLMLLRGDPPKQEFNTPAQSGAFKHASDLIHFASNGFDFCKGAACYVDKHPEAPSMEEDMNFLKVKVDSGADFLISQLFFVNKNYFQYIENAEKAGIKCRIIPGIIPITSFKQIERFTKMSGAVIPPSLARRIEQHKDDPVGSYQIGIEYTVNQCNELLEGGAPGIHFYTLNKSRAAVQIFELINPGSK
ncbi:MAG: methylenetetrahydrofolate reductase [NAD(P)H] [Bacteroidales bacterium]|nr:methylenetetrahydrofolate reductase [NAD(P)H] [Bacteroidales bacterium]